MIMLGCGVVCGSSQQSNVHCSVSLVAMALMQNTLLSRCAVFVCNEQFCLFHKFEMLNQTTQINREKEKTALIPFGSFAAMASTLLNNNRFARITNIWPQALRLSFSLSFFRLSLQIQNGAATN